MALEKDLKHTYFEDKSESEHLIMLLNLQGLFNYQVEDITFSDVEVIPDVEEDNLDEDKRETIDSLYKHQGKASTYLVEVNKVLQANTKVYTEFREDLRGYKFPYLTYHRNSLIFNLRAIFGDFDLPVNVFTLSDPSNLETVKEESLDYLATLIPFRKNSIKEVKIDTANKVVKITPIEKSLLFTPDNVYLIYDIQKRYGHDAGIQTWYFGDSDIEDLSFTHPLNFN